MPAAPSRQIFVNLAVRDLPRSIEFFRKLGFSFDPRFTDESATCMIIGENSYAMLLTEAKFRVFTKNELCDTRRQTEVLLALSCASREEVDEMVRTAVACGGRPAMDAQDHGFMYGWSFYDPDGHHWEVLWMDPEAVPA